MCIDKQIIASTFVLNCRHFATMVWLPVLTVAQSWA